jgi:undecaprenyl diphosphate synthase
MRSAWPGGPSLAAYGRFDGVNLDGISLDRVPAHIACVMDGNRRWAAGRGLPHTEGHLAGEEALFDAVEGALELGVKWLTVYAFSTENWRRPPDEVRFLMHFNESLLLRRRAELTSSNRRMTLTLAFNYGGRAEIVDAVRQLVADGVPAAKVNERAIRSRLYFPDMPDPDMMIRTSGELRVSNFLLWEMAYSELVFVDVLWPDFRRQHLADAVREFQGRERRYGGREDLA